MDMRKTAALFLIICLVLLAGCSNTDLPGENNIPDIPDFSGEVNSLPSDIAGEAGGFHYGGSAEWPDYIPADIPELQGEISMVMEAPESHIRMFYEDITEGQIEDYLSELQAAGFQLEYLVYVREGFPDNSEERIKKGEYDAVDITKGEYHMRLEFGGNSATYDVSVTGFEDAVATATTLQWPSDLNGIVPPPERCALTSINQTSGIGAGYSIMCTPEDDEVFSEYVNSLYALDFYKDPSIVSVDENQNLWLTDGAMSVQIQYSISSELMLLIEEQTANAEAALAWPQELEDLIPQPERCEITSVLPSADFLISCKPEDPDVLQDYLSVLRDLGFEEDNIFEGIDGEILSVTMVKMGTSVDLMISPDSIMIHVK